MLHRFASTEGRSRRRFCWPVVPVFLGGALAATNVFGDIESGAGGVRLTVDIAVGLLGCAMLVAVHRWPVLAAVVLAALAAVAATATPPATIAIVKIAQRERPAVVSVAVTAGVLGHAIYGLWRPIPGLPYGWWLVLTLVAYAALVGWGTLVKVQRALIRSLRERARRAEAEQGRRIAEARAAERTALAREMHDVLAHRLSLVATHAGALEYREDATPAQVAKAAGVIREGVHQALGELRDVIDVLRTDDEPADRPQPGLADVAQLVADVRAAGVTVHLDEGIADESAVPAAVGRTGYRVVQEAVTNARKHAAGSPVYVEVGGAPGEGLRLEIRNPTGTSETILPGTGTGLIGLTERVRLVGGRLDHESTRSGEFRLRAWLPWPA